MKRDMEAVTKAQANYTNLLKAHFKEAQEIHIRTGKVFEQNNKNKGRGAEAELAEFEMYRTANALEAMKIDSSEMVKAAKDSTDFAKTPGILAAIHRTFNHFVMQLTANERLITPPTTAKPSPAPAQAAVLDPSASPLLIQEPLASPLVEPPASPVLGVPAAPPVPQNPQRNIPNAPPVPAAPPLPQNIGQSPLAGGSGAPMRLGSQVGGIQ